MLSLSPSLPFWALRQAFLFENGLPTVPTPLPSLCHFKALARSLNLPPMPCCMVLGKSRGRGRPIVPCPAAFSGTPIHCRAPPCASPLLPPFPQVAFPHLTQQ